MNTLDTLIQTTTIDDETGMLKTITVATTRDEGERNLAWLNRHREAIETQMIAADVKASYMKTMYQSSPNAPVVLTEWEEVIPAANASFEHAASISAQFQVDKPTL